MFVAINQMGHSAKKRKKPETETDAETEKHENNIIMPKGVMNGYCAAVIGRQITKMPSAVSQQQQLPTPLTTTTTQQNPVSVPVSVTNRDDAFITIATATATSATTSPPAFITSTKFKNCQYNLQNDREHAENNCQWQQQQQLPLQHNTYQSNKRTEHMPSIVNKNACHHQQQQNETKNKNNNNIKAVTATTNTTTTNKQKSRNSLLSNCNKAAAATNTTNTILPDNSLYTIYSCLAILTLALATLSVLFYSHVSSNDCHNSTFINRNGQRLPNSKIHLGVHEGDSDTHNNFLSHQEQFRRELLTFEPFLRTMIEQIVWQQISNNREQLQIAAKSIEYAPNNSNYSDANDTPVSGQNQRTSAVSQHHRTFVNVPENDQNNAEDVDDKRPYYNKDNNNNNTHNKNNNTHNKSNINKNNNQSSLEKTIAASKRRKRRDISSSPATAMHADAFIEFFTPNHRKELEEQDLEIRKRNGLKGAAPGGDDWIYLNTYCRVPEKMITGFCKGTQEYCPPSPPGPPGDVGPKGPSGPPGLPGIPGPKGNRGDVGLPGPPGANGVIGPVGLRGPKGDTGIPGRSGLDGRDGVPGEPGLDGVPGRAGADGVPGKDGIPGRDGNDGQNGKDGKDGAQGPKGTQGPPGERGLKGIAGPRGRPGKPGTNGVPGVPGINAWKVQFHNGSYATDLLIPPSITDTTAPYDQRILIVEEGKTLNLSCAATGNPLPHVEWRRDDGHTINVNGIEMSSINGEFLKFVNITRNQMAAYTCYANNGIAPVANATFLVEVQFPPMISVYRQEIYTEYGRAATLECLVEAYPEAIKYWERAYDGKILDPGDKYRIETYPDGFKAQMRLTITNLRKDDFGSYYCVARNELNATMVNFTIVAQDPDSQAPYVGKEVKIFGKPPPESGCPVCDICPDPSLLQCKDLINTNFEVQPSGNYSYPGLPKRKKSCLLYAVGKPVFHKFVDENYGSWLKDSAAADVDRDKTYVTHEKDNFNLYEFTSKIQYRKNDVPRKKYEIAEGFQGNAHVVYNGSFYYQQYNTDLVVKMDLTTMKKTSIQLPYAGIATGNKLYSTDYNYMDFNVDEVGLWVIYSTHDSNNTLVAKLNAENLRVQYNFNITLDHRKFGEMFIVCGHLYAIDSGQEKNSQIRYAVDLYNGKLLNIDLPFTNPFRKTTTVGYNPYTVELYSWDKGNALTYPIRYHEQSLGGDHT